MKKYILFALFIFILVGCTDRRARLIDNLTMAFEVEIISEAKYDAFAFQARNDSAQANSEEFELLFTAARDSKTTHVGELGDILEAYGVMPRIEIPGISYDSDNMLNLKAATDSEVYMIDLYRQILKDIPRRDTTSARETITRLLEGSRSQLSILEAASTR